MPSSRPSIAQIAVFLPKSRPRGYSGAFGGPGHKHYGVDRYWYPCKDIQTPRCSPVFIQNCLNRHSPGVVPRPRHREGTGSIRAAQRFPAEHISAGAMGREGVGRFHKARRAVRVSDSSGCGIYHSSPHPSDRRKHYCRERELVPRYGPSVQPSRPGTNGYGDVWNSAQEHGALCVVEDGNDFTDSRNRAVCVCGRRACVRAY